MLNFLQHSRQKISFDFFTLHNERKKGIKTSNNDNKKSQKIIA